MSLLLKSREFREWVADIMSSATEQLVCLAYEYGCDPKELIDSTYSAAKLRNRHRRYSGEGLRVKEPKIQDAENLVPVVLCKDCKHRNGVLGQPNIFCGQMHDNDFCSYGEKME